MLQIGITGGIGSGKSLVCRLFNLLGVPVYDSDSRAKSVMTSDGILVEAIRKEFGSLAYATDGSLNRAYLADRVFNNQKNLEKLNALVHPAVKRDYQTWVSRQNAPYVIKEAALLYETGTYKDLHEVGLVMAPEALRIQRVRERDPHRSDNEIRNIIQQQMKAEENVKKAGFVIWNDESRLVIPQVLEQHQRLRAAHA
jgi:dephospho-CoA kinase